MRVGILAEYIFEKYIFCVKETNFIINLLPVIIKKLLPQIRRSLKFRERVESLLDKGVSRGLVK